MRTILGAFVLLLASMAAHGSSCKDLEAGVESKVSTLASAEDDLGLFRSIGDEALDAVKQCPVSARLWYLAARAAEVLEVPMSGKAFEEFGGLKKIVCDAMSHVPKSVEIATIAARVDGTAAAARKALAIDPEYTPARRALAIALAKEGAIDEALRLCSAKSFFGADQLTRGRVLLAANRPSEAASEAKKALAAGRPDPAEPTPAIEIQRDANEVLGFALLKEGHKSEAQRAFRIAAAAGSSAAQSQISRPK
jgi:tetratricopeptide (TPR) repeat protein